MESEIHSNIEARALSTLTTKRKTKIFFTFLILLGLVSLLTTVYRGEKLLDNDEAAWIFDSYYLDLYASGDWNNKHWMSFEKYACHPPAAKYLFGILLHTINKPMKSMEPRQFWYENDLDIVNFPKKFMTGLHERISPDQIIACRYMSAVLAWISAVTLLFLAWRLGGPIAGAASFLLLIVQPSFRFIATLATADSFVIMLSVLSIFLTIEINHAISSHKAKTWYLYTALTITLGLIFTTKISSYALLPALICTTLFLSSNLRTAAKTVIAILVATFFAFGIAYLLDPALHASPISTTLERIAWRMDRIDIQQTVFISQKLSTFSQRLAYTVYSIFFSSAWAILMFIMFISGVVSCFMRSSAGITRSRLLILFLTLYFFTLTLTTLPMTWIRYLVLYLPFIALMAGLGVASIIEFSSRWNNFSPRKHHVLLLIVATILITTTLLWRLLLPVQAHMPPAPTQSEIRIARMFAYSLIHPQKNREVHLQLLKYFLNKGNEKRAAYQRQQLKLMDK